MGIVGDFSLINPYGVRVKGFLLWSVRVKGCPSWWLGLRVSRGNGLGLRVRPPDGHVILLIPLYLTRGVFAVLFPSSSLPFPPLIS